MNDEKYQGKKAETGTNEPDFKKDDEIKSRLKQQFEFILEIDKEKEIERQTPLADGSRKENDAEHAWHMAIMVMLLSEYANESIDVLRTIEMLLIHDLVEVYSGDTYAYDEEGKKTQKMREEAAAQKLYRLLPQDQGEQLYQLWEEFEEEKTNEAKFARTMDNLQPMMLNAASNGISWKEHEVKLSQILKRNEKTQDGSLVLWQYAKEMFLEPSVKAGYIADDV